MPAAVSGQGDPAVPPATFVCEGALSAMLALLPSALRQPEQGRAPWHPREGLAASSLTDP